MKQIYLYFIPIFIAFLLASCTSDNPENEDVSKGSEISFAVADQTRASGAPSFNKFVLFGDMKFLEDNDNNAVDPKVIFSKTDVEYKESRWWYEGIQYWFPRHEHSFVAVAPVSALETSIPQYLNSQLSFKYIIPTGTDNKVASRNDVADIIAATHRRLYNDGDTNNTTTFRFGHIMSQINLSALFDDNIMTSDEYIKIHKIEWSGIKTQATFNILPASRQSNSQTDDRVIEVYGQEKDGSLTLDFSEPIKVVNNREPKSLFYDNDAIIMLPQTFASDSGAKISLSYSINDETSIKQITLPFINQKWESGKSYTYRFTINRTGAKFETSSITDWEMMNVGNINAH